MATLPVVETPRIPVTTSYHGVEVTEDYRWLEDDASEDTIAWTKAQQHLTGSYFDAVPWRATLRARVEELLRSERTTYRSLVSGGSTYFALKEQTPRQQPFLVALDDLDDTTGERVVVDPDAIDPSGETTIDWFVPSPDGRRVAVSLSEHGTEDGSLHVVDVESGEVVDEPIPHVNLMGGSMAWRQDGSGFWYTRCADPAGLRQQVWFHELGGADDQPDVPEGFADPEIAENFLTASPDGRWLMDRVQKGDGGEWQVFVRRQEPEGTWWQLADIPDKCPYAVLGTGALYLLSRRDAPRGKVLRLDADRRGHRRGRRGDRAGEPPGHRGPRRDRRHGLGRGHGRRPPAAAGVRPRGPSAAHSRDPAGQFGLVVHGRPQQAGARPGGLVVRVVHPATHVVGGRRRRGAPADGRGGVQRRRPVRLRGDPRVRRLTRRHAGAPQHHFRARHPAGRERAGAADGVRRLCDLPGADVRPGVSALARAGWRPGDRQHPRWRRVRRGVAPRGSARPASRTASTTSSRARTTWSTPASPAGTGWRSSAAPTEVC